MQFNFNSMHSIRSPRAEKRFLARKQALRENFHELGELFREKYKKTYDNFHYCIARRWVEAILTRDGTRLRFIREIMNNNRLDCLATISNFQIHDSVWELSNKWNAKLER
jgi:hypothetical protein